MEEIKKAVKAISTIYDAWQNAIEASTPSAYLSTALSTVTAAAAVDWKEAAVQYGSALHFVETREEIKEIVSQHFDLENDKVEAVLEALHELSLEGFNLYEAVQKLLNDKDDNGFRPRSTLIN